jgi:hypothetical protein
MTKLSYAAVSSQTINFIPTNDVGYILKPTKIISFGNPNFLKQGLIKRLVSKLNKENENEKLDIDCNIVGVTSDIGQRTN